MAETSADSLQQSGATLEMSDFASLLQKEFKPKSDEVMERKPSEVTEALDEFGDPRREDTP